MRNSRNNRSQGNNGRQSFASMDQQRQREISNRGGRASHGGNGRQENEYSDNYQGGGQSNRYRDEFESDGRQG